MERKTAYIKMQGISKRFGSITANKNINLGVNKGEIVALLGENGAGKSTLMNMLSGIYTPDSGSIYIEEQAVRFHSPKDSINRGIGMIHQHFKLIDVLTARENIVLGHHEKFFTDKKQQIKKIQEISTRYGIEVDTEKRVSDMSVGEKQNLEILKVLYRNANILILDEPTAVLTPQEIKKLFVIINNMKAQGCAIVFISHKMNEVMEISDYITVLRKGQVITTVAKSETSPKELTELMVGSVVELSIHRPDVKIGEILLQVKSLNIKDQDGIPALKNINFYLHKGEILGIAGIAGSGQKELCEAIAGLYKVDSGEILFENDNLVGKTPKEIITKGISMSFVPEDRLGMGLVAEFGIIDNMLLKNYLKQPGLLIDKKPAIKKAKEIVERLEISTPGLTQPIRQLSGGNIQKVLLGRELDMHPNLLITAYPVRGLDVNASHKIYDLLNEEKKKGVGVLFIGEDLDVLLELCDRIMVMYDGEVTGIVKATETNKEKLGMMMVGEKNEI